MSTEGLKRIIDGFAGRSKLPVEISEIRDAIVAYGFRDEILIRGEAADPGKVRGLFYQYTKNDTVYAPPTLCTIVVYNSLLPVPWQRLVSAKELVHVFDGDIEQTDTPDEVVDLLEKLVGPMSTDDAGVADLMALSDKLALYKCLPLLIPRAARTAAIAQISNGNRSLEQIAAQACIPEVYCKLVLSATWEPIEARLLEL